MRSATIILLLTAGAAMAGLSENPAWTSGFEVPGLGSYAQAVEVESGSNGDIVYVGGNFITAGGLTVSKVAKWNGKGWEAMGTNMSGTVTALKLFNDGSGTKLYAASGGVVYKYNGTSWVTAGNSFNSTVYALAVFNDGTGEKLYAGGMFLTALPSTAVNCIAKLEGTAWTAVGGGFSGYPDSPIVYCLEAASEAGTPVLYAGGRFTSAGTTAANHIAKFKDGQWSDVGVGVGGEVRAIKVVGTDVYAGGTFTWAGNSSNSVKNIAKFSGGAWYLVGTELNARVAAIVSNGTDVFAGGNFASGFCRFSEGHWQAAGGGFNSGALLYAAAQSKADPNHFWIVGSFTSAGSQISANIVKWTGTGYDSIGTGLNANVRALGVHKGKLYAGGEFTSSGGATVTKFAGWANNEYPAEGEGIGTGANGNVLAIASMGDYLYAGGEFTSMSGVNANRIAKYDGTGWSALTANGMTGAVRVIVPDPCSTLLYVGGDFGSPGARIAKWNGTWFSGLGTGMDNSVRAIAFYNGELYAAGDFSQAGGLPALKIAKWNGTAWSAVGGGFNGNVYALTTATIGGQTCLYAGGYFTTAGGPAAKYVAKWNGSNWTAVGTGMNNPVFALAAVNDANGTRLFAGGNFKQAGTTVVNYIAKWDGTSWTTVGSGMGADVYALAAMADSRGPAVYAGGAFTMAGGYAAGYLARYGRQNVTADIDNNGTVDGMDLLTIMEQWLNSCSGTGWCEGADLNLSGEVDFVDFGHAASYWGK